MSHPTVKEVFEKHDSRLSRLFEDRALAGYAEAPVDVPPESGGDDQVAAAFKSMIDSVLDDGGLDLAAKLSKIREILKAQEKLTGGGADSAADDTRASPPPVAESASDVIGRDPTVRQLLERLDRIENEAACRSLLEAHHRSCDAMRLKALAALATEPDRVKLIESWPERSPANGSLHTRPAVSRPLVEAESVTLPKDAKSLALALR